MVESMVYTAFISLITLCSYYSGTRLIIIGNICFIAFSGIIFFFLDTAIGDTLLVITAFGNIFYLNYTNFNSYVYSKYTAIMSFITTITLAIYFLALSYDIMSGSSLDGDSSPVKWFVDFICDHSVSVAHCAPKPITDTLQTINDAADAVNKAADAIDHVATAVDNLAVSADNASDSARPYVKGVVDAGGVGFLTGGT
jgi:methyl-accepting chemotaxis protein